MIIIDKINRMFQSICLAGPAKGMRPQWDPDRSRFPSLTNFPLVGIYPRETDNKLIHSGQDLRIQIRSDPKLYAGSVNA